MREFATLFIIFAAAAGCRGDYPSLASAPDKAPRYMLEARETAFVRQAKISAASRPSSKKKIKETLLDNPMQLVFLLGADFRRGYDKSSEGIGSGG